MTTRRTASAARASTSERAGDAPYDRCHASAPDAVAADRPLMFGWLKRLLGLAPAAAGASVSPSRRPAPAPAAASAAVPAASNFGLRRPLLGRGGRVAGFELLLPPAAQKRLAERGDSPAAVAHHVALLSAATALAAGGRSPLVQLPAMLLERPAVAAVLGPGVMLLLDKPAAVKPELLGELRARGVLLGAPDGPPSRTPPVDFVALHAAGGGIDTLLLSAQRWREVLPRILIVGLGLDDLEDLEQALQGGVTLAGGRMGRSARSAPKRDLGSAAHRICELLNHLALDRGTGVIAEAVRGDVALTYRLLRYANSPAIGLPRAVETVDDAVTLLGRNELYRWLSVQLMSAAAARQASKALEEAALARGRVLEAVARHRSDDNPGAHFTLGLLSLIEQLLQTPMAAALAPLRVSDTARQALLERAGPWADRLRLLDLLDAGQGDQADALASALGVQAELPQIIEDAWRWAAEVREGAGAQK